MELTKLFILLLVTYQGDCVLRAVNSYISGFERQSVSVRCSYDKGYADYVKYWCQGEDWENCETVQSSDSQSQGNKIVINDYRFFGEFTVTINNLEKSDAGTYWCAIQRTGYDYNARVRLEVKEGVSTLSVSSSSISGFEGQAASRKCSYNMGYSTFVKYFCRGDGSWNCEIMRKTSQLPKNGDTFFITDDKTSGVFTMTINRLEKSDVGSYWCGIEKLGHNNRYAVVRLNVIEGVSTLSVSSRHISGLEGQATSMQCSYNLGYSNFVKYWCRGDKWRNCVTLCKTSETQCNGDKFFIRDDKTHGEFTMTINRLEKSDVGSYRCGIEKLGHNDDQVVTLNVIEGVSTLKVSNGRISGFEGLVTSVQCSYNLGYSNFVKYWCRGEKLSNCIILRKTSETQNKGDKYFIRDDKTRGDFTMTINQLERSDTGSYWCGIEKLDHSKSNAVVRLTVVEGVSTLSVKNGRVSGFEGLATSMQCSYNLRYSNFVKYWCRGDKPSNCITLRKTNEIQKTTDKFFIRDDERHGELTMTINRLERSDAGSYWCGIEKLDNNKSSAVVKLTVVEGVSTLSVSTNNISGFEGQAASVQCFYHLGYSTFAKYWCRGDKSRNCDILSNTSKPQTREDKIVISDNQNRGVFTVTINRLERSDSGSYWCGIENLGRNVNAVVTLTVSQVSATPSVLKEELYALGNVLWHTELFVLLPSLTNESVSVYGTDSGIGHY
ncbi:polymeric immunoglobulin receptor-like [Polypterus senegalus]|uniref:polymeric immunoglobulin receptor-like n=1 Tax=Polypterus senegalus TaxID=55291 RepID=UPI00196550CF|nr:polymeric immunoglobulin receptor-like [Polypterus senegalus]